MYETHASGRFRKENITPMVGDRVKLSENNDYIVEILPRKTEFIRPPVANIDQMLIVASAVSPNIDYYMIDSLILNTEFQGLDTVICINKSDLAEKDICDSASEIYKKAGYRVIITSAHTKSGINELRDALKDKTTALSGNSGVGKSSILNLLDNSFDVQTGKVSKKLDRGRHTTRHVELFPLSFGGYVLDTPGFAKMNLPQITTAQLSGLYKEMAVREDKCKFKGCLHIAEPDCGIIKAVENGDISKMRYESYKYFYDKLKNVKEWNKND